MNDVVNNGRYLEKVVNEFTKIIDEFMEKGILSKEDIRDYKKSNLHSWLQYAMIKAGDRLGLLAVPEIKLDFIEPLKLVNKKKKRHFKRVDVGFYDNNKRLLGISEIFTIDGAHACLPTSKFIKILIYTIQNSYNKPEFLILVIALPKRSKYIAWKTGISKIDSELRKNKNYYTVFRDCWIKFKDKLKRYVNCSLIIISEDKPEPL